MNKYYFAVFFLHTVISSLGNADQKIGKILNNPSHMFDMENVE